jgi:hypothetical protein
MCTRLKFRRIPGCPDLQDEDGQYLPRPTLGQSGDVQVTENSATTKFISEATPVVKTVLQLLSNAHSKIDGVGNPDTPSLIVKVNPYWNALAAVMQSNANEGPTIRGRYITDITQQNLKACKKLINELHFDLRHLEGVRSNILISEKEFAIDLSPRTQCLQPRDSFTKQGYYTTHTRYCKRQREWSGHRNSTLSRRCLVDSSTPIITLLTNSRQSWIAAREGIMKASDGSQR